MDPKNKQMKGVDVKNNKTKCRSGSKNKRNEGMNPKNNNTQKVWILKTTKH